MTLEIQVLGRFAVISEGKQNGALHSPRMQALITYLGLHLDVPIPRSQLAYLFWPDSTESQAHTNLRKTIHKIRQALPESAAILDAGTAGMRLPGSDVRVDAVDFLSALDVASQARRTKSAEAEEAALEQAVTYYRGDLLPGCYDEWILSERERLRNLAIEALGRLSAMLENRQHYRDAIRHTERLLEYEPWHEEAYRQLMRLYLLVGDRAAALHAYHRCVTVLRDDLNSSPTDETRQTYKRIMEIESGQDSLHVATLEATTRLVGRRAEFGLLQAAWRSSLAKLTQLMLISGEPGIGKTRLADEMLEWARKQGILTARAVCFAAEGSLAFAPVTAWLSSRPLPALEPHWLSEIARLVPETLYQYPALDPPAPITEPWQRQHLFEALARGLLHGDQPRLLLLDNIQWCDRDTLQWLHFLLRSRPHARLLVLATGRPEEIEPQSSADELLTALAASQQLSRLELPRLNAEESGELASQMSNHELDAVESATIFRESEGVPLFIVETVRAGQGGAAIGPAFSAAALPGTVQAVITQRLHRLPAPTLATLETAAVVGREFSVDLLRLASHLDEPVLIQALDDLWRHRLINERGGVYDFSHDKIREVVYAGLNPDRRRWLHRVVAELPEATPLEQSEAVSAQIAAHFEGAGVDQRAAEYYLRAARQAKRLFATEEALRRIQRAITLNHESQRLPELFEEQGDLLAFRQQHKDAGIAYREALIACPQAEWLRRARLHRKYALVFSRVDNVLAEQAIQLAENSLANIREHTPEYWQEWIHFYLSRLDASYWRWDWEEMTALLERLAPVIEAHGTLRQQVTYLDSLMRRNCLRSRYQPEEETIGLARRGRQLLETMGDLDASAQGQSTLGFVLHFANQLDEAEGCLRDAIQKASQTGNQNVLLISLCYQSLTHRRQGRVEDVRADSEMLERALAQSSITAYEGVLRANRAWVAYRDHRPAEARVSANEAIRIWSVDPLPYPVQWPGWSVAFALAAEAGDAAEAEACIRALLRPLLIALAPAVSAGLQAALDASCPVSDFLPGCKQVIQAMRADGYL